jgi:glucan phosphoethanolaminetransferase (alkaline phosphatase superfamily)
MLHLKPLLCHISLSLSHIHYFNYCFFYNSNLESWRSLVSSFKGGDFLGFLDFACLVLSCVWWCLIVIQTRKIIQLQRARRSLNYIKHLSFLFQFVSHLLFSSCFTWSTSVVVALICLLLECELLSSPGTLSPRYTLISLFLLPWLVCHCKDLCFIWFSCVMISGFCHMDRLN